MLSTCLITPGLRRFGLLAAVLALVSQITLGFASSANMRREQLDAVSALSSICQVGPGRGAPANNPPQHHAPDCALCACSVGLSVPVLIVEPVSVPGPVTWRVTQALALPPARAPPAVAIRPAFPRGPPVLA